MALLASLAHGSEESSWVLPESVSLMTRASDPFLSNLQVEARKTRYHVEKFFQYVDYQLVLTGFSEEHVGDISLVIEKEKDYVRISALKNRTYVVDTGRSIIKKVGTAGLELAFRISHLAGKSGQIQFRAASDSPAFYFSWGFRFAPASNDPYLAHLVRTSQMTASELQTKTQALSSFTFEEMTFLTKLSLGREPENINEVLAEGASLTKDKIMQLLIEHKKTPREKIPLLGQLRSEMYLPPSEIEKKRVQYLLS